MEPTMNVLAHTDQAESSTDFSSDGRHDDLDLMLLHIDFPKLIELAARVKKARRVLVQAPASPADVRSALDWREVEQAVARMQEQLLQRPPNPRNTIHRGHFPIIDCTIDDAIATLQREWDHLSAWIERGLVSSTNAKEKSTKKRGRAKKEAIAVKYSKWQTDILMAWMIDNKDQPFPGQDAIRDLMQRTGLNQSQVVNWTTNVRKRNRKATCEGGKKPHHFIDFLFLVQDRQAKESDTGGEDSSIKRSASFPPSRAESKAKRKTRSSTQSIVPSATMSQNLMGERSDDYHDVSTIPPSPIRKSVRVMRPRGSPTVKAEANHEEGVVAIEPLPFENTIIDESLMKEFAKVWLLPGREPGILPSVTEDSIDLPPPTLERLPSFELVDFDDIHSWAGEMGLTIEV